eukprot:gene6622-9090_t
MINEFTTSLSQSFNDFWGSDAYYSIVLVVIGLAIFSFVWSIIGQNCSKVDQLWSITPVVYSWLFYMHYSYQQQVFTPHYRLLLLSCLITLWGIRLTFNFWRKGGYGNLIHHEEDYRWPILRQKMHPIIFLIFNLTFIASYQNLLLFLIVAPAYQVMKGPSAIEYSDIGVATLFLLLLTMESIADEQHFRFQEMKKKIPLSERVKHTSQDIKNGYFTSGLFHYSRHPNYFAEQMMWVCVYLFSITPVGSTWINWHVSGCIQLILLFQGSMSFGESITISKYPSYRKYQRTTSQ